MSHIEDLFNLYESKNINEFNAKQMNRYTTVKKYYFKEKKWTKRFENKIANLQSLKDKEKLNVYAMEKQNDKSLNQYLKLKGLSVDSRAVEKYKLNLAKKNEEKKGLYNHYSKQLDTAKEQFAQKLDSIYSDFNQNYKNDYYAKLLNTEKVLNFNKQTGKFDAIDGNEFLVTGEANADKLKNNKNFMETLTKNGLLDIDDEDIPEGFLVELNGSMFSSDKYYVFTNGKWHVAYKQK